MGLFSSKYETYVASSVWNMAGDPDYVPKVIPSLVLSAALSKGSVSIGEQLSKGLLSNTFRKTHQFIKWAPDHYVFGAPTGSVSADLRVEDPLIVGTLSGILGLAPNQKLRVISARVDDLDVGYWAEDWLARERPLIDRELSKADGGFDASYNFTTNHVVIEMPSETITLPATTDLLWALANRDRKLLYIAYEVLTKDLLGTWVTAPNQLYTYQMGSGTALFDALTPPSTALAQFAPAIPIRLNNTSITDRPDFSEIKKAFRKLVGGKIEKVIDTIEEHESVEDMDYVLILPSVSLNSKEKACKAYIYEFLKNLMNQQKVAITSSDYIEKVAQGIQSQRAWDRWKRSNKPEASGGLGPTSPYYASPAPVSYQISKTRDPVNQVQIRMPSLPAFDFRLLWGSITERICAGNASRFDGKTTRAKMSKGDYKLVAMTPIRYEVSHGRNSEGDLKISYGEHYRFAVLHQFEEYRYRWLEVVDFEHRNAVYQGHYVKIRADEAIVDDELSGFLLPLHLPTMKEMRAVDQTNLTGHNIHLVINSYERVKVKWYQRGIFKLVMIVAMIAFTVITGGVGALGAQAGILGTNAALGASLGLTGVTAAIAGAVVNGIAGIILTTVISDAATMLFGDKLGAILSTILSLVVPQLVGSITNPSAPPIDWSAVFRVDNLMKLTDAVTGAAGLWLQLDTLGIQDAMERAENDYDEQMKEIREKSMEILGVSNVAFDVRLLTDAAEYLGETSEVFLGRTLMTGTDIIRMSHSLIYDFAEMSLELPGPR